MDILFFVSRSFLDCLRSFTDLEELDETELYMCHKCKKKQKSTKKFWIQKLPKVRVSMKRLQCDVKGNGQRLTLRQAIADV